MCEERYFFLLDLEKDIEADALKNIHNDSPVFVWGRIIADAIHDLDLCKFFFVF